MEEEKKSEFTELERAGLKYFITKLITEEKLLTEKELFEKLTSSEAICSLMERKLTPEVLSTLISELQQFSLL